MNYKNKKKVDQCAPLCSILPICILVSILTAVLVTLIFSIAFVRSFKLETRTSYSADGAFKAAIASSKKDADGITLIDGEAVVDFFASGRTGFIYASDDECVGCEEFGKVLAEHIEDAEIADVYHYKYDADGAQKSESSARETTIGQEKEPVLLYIRNGRIHDRLDVPKDESDLDSFLAKYK